MTNSVSIRWPLRCVLVKLGSGERSRVHGQGHSQRGFETQRAHHSRGQTQPSQPHSQQRPPCGQTSHRGSCQSQPVPRWLHHLQSMCYWPCVVIWQKIHIFLMLFCCSGRGVYCRWVCRSGAGSTRKKTWRQADPRVYEERQGRTFQHRRSHGGGCQRSAGYTSYLRASCIYKCHKKSHKMCLDGFCFVGWTRICHHVDWFGSSGKEHHY